MDQRVCLRCAIGRDVVKLMVRETLDKGLERQRVFFRIRESTTAMPLLHQHVYRAFVARVFISPS